MALGRSFPLEISQTCEEGTTMRAPSSYGPGRNAYPGHGRPFHFKLVAPVREGTTRCPWVVPSL
jgi:hypothetical protein